MSKRSNPVNNELKDIDDDFTRETVNAALVLAGNGKPATISELKERIERFFKTCADSGVRPGYEGLSASLCVNRSTFWRWKRGEGCNAEWSEVCQRAASIIDIYLEQAVLQGKISPPSGIFLMKNWLGYKDLRSVEDMTPRIKSNSVLTADQLPSLSDLNKPKGGASCGDG